MVHQSGALLLYILICILSARGRKLLEAGADVRKAQNMPGSHGTSLPLSKSFHFAYFFSDISMNPSGHSDCRNLLCECLDVCCVYRVYVSNFSPPLKTSDEQAFIAVIPNIKHELTSSSHYYYYIQ